MDFLPNYIYNMVECKCDKCQTVFTHKSTYDRHLKEKYKLFHYI